MTAEILVTEEDGIRIVRMNRPEKKNALTQTMYTEMTHALREAEARDAIRCVVLTGSPGAFCAGSDISDFQRRAEGGLKPVTVDFLHALARNPKPLLAAVDGLAIGIGTTMLLHCDYVVAARGATFATPFTKLGLIPEAASSLLGPMRMGHARAFALLVMGRSMSAEDAKAAGLINAVVDPTALDANPGAPDGSRRPRIGSKAFGNDPDVSGFQFLGLGSSIFHRQRSRGDGQASEGLG